MLSGFSLWQDEGFLRVYAEERGWSIDEIGGIKIMVSRLLWRVKAEVKADEIPNADQIWNKYPSAVLKSYTPITGCQPANNRGTYLIELNKPFTFKKNTRNQLRKAQRQGFTVEKANLDGLNEWHRLYRRNGVEHGFNTQSQKVMKALLQSPYGCLITAHKDGELAAGYYLLIGKDAAMEWAAAFNRRYTSQNPNNLLHDEIITALTGRVKVYDFGGVVKGSSIDHFKQGFGGIYMPLYIYGGKQ